MNYPFSHHILRKSSKNRLDIVSTLVLQVSIILSHSYLIIIYNIAMNKEELSNLKVSELKEIAKEKQIPVFRLSHHKSLEAVC